MAFRCLFHVHTRHSMDSVLPPAKIAQEARKEGVDVLIVTDHETIRGSQEVRKITEASPQFLVPIAAEYKTEKGDVIGIFLKEEIRAASAQELVRQIHEQGGLAVLPHPFKAHRLDDDFLSEIDLIETHNSRCSSSENDSARGLAQRLARPFLGGADAHCAGELGAVMNCFSADVPKDEAALRHSLLHAPREVVPRQVSAIFRPYSQMVKAVKTRNPVLFLSQSRRLAMTWVRESWRRST